MYLIIYQMFYHKKTFGQNDYRAEYFIGFNASAPMLLEIARVDQKKVDCQEKGCILQEKWRLVVTTTYVL